MVIDLYLYRKNIPSLASNAILHSILFNKKREVAMSEYSQRFIDLLKQLREDPDSRRNILEDRVNFLNKIGLTQQEIKLLEQYQTAEELEDGIDDIITNIADGSVESAQASAEDTGKIPTVEEDTEPESSEPAPQSGQAVVRPTQTIPESKLPISGPGFLIAFSYLLLVIAYWALSLLLPQTLQLLGLPLWGDINLIFRWIIMIYWFIAGGSVVAGIYRGFKGMRSPTRVSLWILIVVLVVIPGSIILGSLPATTQIIIAQITLILVFTAVPASLYPLFITSKGKTLWEEFIQNLSFIDPVGYKAQEPIYNKKFIALYGQISGGLGQQFLAGEKTFPVLLNIFIIGFGWLLFFLTSEEDATITTGVITPFTFGFLGAYIFSLQMLFRRYVQLDLKTTAYTHASQRILITWVWAFVLSILPWNIIGLDSAYQNQIISVLAFAVGIFPDIAWQVIGRFIKLTLGLVIPSFRQEHPLNDINGITVWVEARLMEENIENIQNLVTTDIPDLILRTNLNPSRIIDWVDQGILRLHLMQKKSENNAELLDALQVRGIIKATDLYFSYNAFMGKNKAGDRYYISKELDPKVETMIDSFEDDINMYHIRAWREVYARQTEMLPEAIENLLKTTKGQAVEPAASITTTKDGEYDLFQPGISHTEKAELLTPNPTQTIPAESPESIL